MSAGAVIKSISIDNYLLAEESSPEKHEYYKGEVFAMAGASIDHNSILSNSLIEIGSFLRGKSCRIFASDLRIQIEANSLFTYPDLTIFCNEIERYENRMDTATNPTIIIEILSKSTQDYDKDYDKGTKFNLYQMIPSLKEYITISPLEVLIEKYIRQAKNEWLYTTYNKPDDSFMIDSVKLLVDVSSLYRNVKFSDE